MKNYGLLQDPSIFAEGDFPDADALGEKPSQCNFF